MILPTFIRSSFMRQIAHLEALVLYQAFVITHPDEARSLLVAHPQLAYALFQALLLNKIVDPAILQVSRPIWQAYPF
jgi:Hinge domain of cleavage stimulation factor subunit 2